MIKARDKALELLEKIKIEEKPDRQRLYDVATTSLRTKIDKKLADQMADICVDGVLSIQRDDGIDLNMVELMEMQHKTSTETTLVKGNYIYFLFFVKLCFINTICNIKITCLRSCAGSWFKTSRHAKKS